MQRAVHNAVVPPLPLSLVRFVHWFWGIYYFWIRDMKSDWPPRPAPQSWHSGGFDDKKCVNATSNNWWRNKHIFGVKIIFGEMSTDWELNPSSRSPPYSHLLSPLRHWALLYFVILWFVSFPVLTLDKTIPWSECKLGKLVFLVVNIGPYFILL